MWSVPRERNRFIGGSVSGYIFGTVLGYPICGTIAYHLNWPAVFYITGNICRKTAPEIPSKLENPF